jgi:hypothetical protein
MKGEYDAIQQSAIARKCPGVVGLAVPPGAAADAALATAFR